MNLFWNFSLFLDNISNNLFLPNNVSDNLNDISKESKKDLSVKQIKFVLTKEEPSVNFLQKKLFKKLNQKMKIMI